MNRIISRKYEELEQLGQGGQAVVYKVRHVDHKTILALKVLPSYLLENEEMVARFEREALLMTRLHHRNIVRVLGSGRDEDLNCHYIVMENIQGKTLKQYLREKGPLPLAEVLEIARQVAGALDYAHNRTPAVIHRDIKPSNIMIEDLTGRAVVLDFGIAKELDDNERTRAGMMIGTWKYSSPEQLRHEPLTGSADVYSLGLVMYEMYTGTQFFSGMDEHAVLGKLLYDSKEHEPYFARPTPPVFVSLVTKTIAKARDKRYPRMIDLLNDLEACWWVLDETKTQVLITAESVSVQPEAGRDRIEEIGEQIRKLEQERQLHMVTLVQRQVQDARARAEKVSAQQWVPALFTEGTSLEEKGAAYLRENQYPLAQETYTAARNAFAQASEEATTVALQRQVAQLRQAVETAKMDTEHYGAEGRAQTFYKRALVLQEQAEELWKQENYEQARQIYGEARSLFEAARDLAYHDALRREAQAARARADTLRESAVEEGAKELTPSIMQEAVATEHRADAAFEREEFTQACTLYQLASQQYEQAQRQTRVVRHRQEIATIVEHVQMWQQRVTEPGVESTKPQYQQAVLAQQQAATYLTAGDYTQAERTYRLAQQLFEEIVRSTERERQQQAVARARRDMEKLRVEAEQAEAPQHVAAAWSKALQVVEKAEQRERQERFDEAVAAYRQAGHQFTQLQQMAIEHLQRTEVDMFRQQLEVVKKQAVILKEWVPNLWTDAQDCEAQAELAYERRAYKDAIARLREAQLTYTRAREQGEVARQRQEEQQHAALEALRQQARRAQLAARQVKAEAEQAHAQQHVYETYVQAVAVYQHAEALWEQGTYTQAIQEYANAQQALVTVRELATRIALTEAAEAARTQMQTARRAAEQVQAAAWASTIWQQAVATEQQAISTFQQEDFVQARTFFLTAQEQYTHATQRAEAERSRQQHAATAAAAEAQSAHERAVAAAVPEIHTIYRQAVVAEQQAEEHFSVQEYDTAIQVYRHARALYEEATLVAERERQQRAIILARQQMTATRQAAIEVAAEQYVETAWNEVQKIVLTAQQCETQGEFTQAIVQYQQAAQRFSELREEAVAQALSQKAQAARQQTQITKTRGAALREWASSLWEKAEVLETRAAQTLSDQHYEDAAQAYVLATQTYQQAIEQAEGERRHQEKQRQAAAAARFRRTESARRAAEIARQQADKTDTATYAHSLYRQAITLYSEAEALWQQQSYEQAGDTYAQAQQIFTQAREVALEEALRKEAEMVQRHVQAVRETAAHAEAAILALRQRADEARQQCTTARLAATDVNAPQRVPLLYSQALSCEAQGEEGWQQERYAEAAQSYSEAQRVFVAAHALAERERRKEEAETSRTDMNQVRETAVRQKAEAFAAVVFREATAAARQADLAFEREDFAPAQKLYQTARQHYEQAQLDANVERQRRRAQAAAQQAHSFQQQAIAAGAFEQTHSLFKQAQDIQQQAAAHFAAHEYEQAAHTYTQAQAFYEETVRLARSVREQQEALNARQQMQAALSAAEQVGAAHRFLSQWQDAQQMVQEAQQREEEKEFSLAVSLYLQGAEQFARLQHETEQQLTQEAEQHRQRVLGIYQQTKQSQQKAEQAEAPRYAADVYAAALRQVQDGQQHLAGSRWDVAESHFVQAQTLFVQSAKHARRQKARHKTETVRNKTQTLYTEAQQKQVGARFPEQLAEAVAALTVAEQAWDREEFAVAQTSFEQAVHLLQQLIQDFVRYEQRDKAEQAKAYAQDWQQKVGPVTGGQKRRAIKAFTEGERYFQQGKYQEAQGQYGKAVSLWTTLLQQAKLSEVVASLSPTEATGVILQPVILPPHVPRAYTRYSLLGIAVLILIAVVYSVNLFRSPVDTSEQKANKKNKGKEEQQLPLKERKDLAPQFSPSLQKTKPVLLPPTIISAIPDPVREFRLKEGARQKFSIQATTAARGILRYVWHLDGKEQVSAGNEWIYEPSLEEGNDNIKTVEVTIIDSDNQKVNQQWQGRVQNVNRPP